MTNSNKNNSKSLASDNLKKTAENNTKLQPSTTTETLADDNIIKKSFTPPIHLEKQENSKKTDK